LNAEPLTGHSGNHDVGVVAVGDCRKSASALDACSNQDVGIKTNANEGLASEVVTKSQERIRPTIHNGDGVAKSAQLAGQRRAHTPTTNDDDVHELPS
jgi:hypothetical protein